MGADQPAVHMGRPERVARPRCHERIADDAGESAPPRQQQPGVHLGFTAEDEFPPVEKFGDRLQALEIQIHVEAAEMVEQEIADRVDPHDRFGIAVVDR
ncbi:hypothetical protein [Streptomyces cucumeris]|uniref:hypothetical protein n=1 Tax=Streptomyces cucumeris TaxID=2962890 RepID=UPI003D742750